MFSALGNEYELFNAGLIFTLEVYILRKKVWESRVPGGMNFYIPFISQSLCTDKHL